MPYCTEQDLIERFGAQELLQLVPDETGEAIDSGAVALACEDASGEIDGYVSSAGYKTPLSPVPRIVRAKAADIARYRLYADHATDQVTKRYDDAIKFFRSVADGKVQLGAKQPEPSLGKVEFESGRRVMKGGGF